MEEKEIDDDDRQSRFGVTDRTGSQSMKRRYILEFKRVTDTGEKYVSETQKLTEIQHLDIT